MLKRIGTHVPGAAESSVIDAVFRNREVDRSGWAGGSVVMGSVAKLLVGVAVASVVKLTTEIAVVKLLVVPMWPP